MVYQYYRCGFTILYDALFKGKRGAREIAPLVAIPAFGDPRETTPAGRSAASHPSTEGNYEGQGQMSTFECRI